MNWFDSITTIGALLCFSYMGYEVLSTHILMSNIVKGKNIPQDLADFPVHQVTLLGYEESRAKVEKFKSAVLKGEKDIHVKLEQSDINNLYAQGVVINKFLPGQYRFFSVESEAVVIRTIDWPSSGSPNAVWYQVSTMHFVNNANGGKPIVLQRIIKERGIFLIMKRLLHS